MLRFRCVFAGSDAHHLSALLTQVGATGQGVDLETRRYEFAVCDKFIIECILPPKGSKNTPHGMWGYKPCSVACTASYLDVFGEN